MSGDRAPRNETEITPFLGEPPTMRRLHGADDALPRVLFYGGDAYGLGHARRTLTIATELQRRRPDAVMLALVGSLEVHAFEVPPGFDYVRLPVLNTNTQQAPNRAIAFRMRRLRQRLVEETVRLFAPRLVVVDCWPVGQHRELLSALADLRASDPQVRIVLGLRDILFEPERLRNWWDNDGVHTVLDYTYDQILVYGSRDVFDPIAEYGFSPRAAAKTVFCGYIRKQEDVWVAPDQIRAELGAGSKPLVVASVGGGTHGAQLIKELFSARYAGYLDDIALFVVTGPLLDQPTLAELMRVAAELPGVTLVPFTDALLSYFNAADLVVMMAGYNSMTEVLSLGKRAVVVPRARPEKEQVMRAERFAARGLVTMLHPNQLTAARLADAIHRTLKSPPPRVSLDFDGLARTGALLAEALGG
jgi:predicted glycosyltransferase